MAVMTTTKWGCAGCEILIPRKQELRRLLLNRFSGLMPTIFSKNFHRGGAQLEELSLSSNERRSGASERREESIAEKFAAVARECLGAGRVGGGAVLFIRGAKKTSELRTLDANSEQNVDERKKKKVRLADA